MLGECMRRAKDSEDQKPKPGSEGLNHCQKLQKILAYAIHNDDLDTMRTCYMIQAYGDMDSKDLKAVAWPAKQQKNITVDPQSNVPGPEKRIIRSSSSNPADMGAGNGTNPGSPARKTVGQAPLILRPVPLDTVGNGKSADRAAPAAEAAPAVAEAK